MLSRCLYLIYCNIRTIFLTQKYRKLQTDRDGNIYIHLSPLSSEIVDNYEVIARQVTTTGELDKARQLPAWRDYQDKNKILQEKCFISKKHRWHTLTFDAIWCDNTWLFVLVRRSTYYYFFFIGYNFPLMDYQQLQNCH